MLRQALRVVRLHEEFQRRKLEGAKSKLQGCVAYWLMWFALDVCVYMYIIISLCIIWCGVVWCVWGVGVICDVCVICVRGRQEQAAGAVCFSVVSLCLVWFALMSTCVDDD